MVQAIVNAIARGVIGVVLVVVVGAAAYWYFGIYDTAAGKCGRGDLGACVVYEAQQPPAPRVVAPATDSPLPGFAEDADVPGNGDVPCEGADASFPGCAAVH